MKFFENKNKIIDITLIIFFLLSVLSLSISNYSPSSYFIKGFFILITWIFFVFSQKQSITNLISYLNLSDKKFLTVLLFFILFAGISLFYSKNFNFGLQKWLSLIFFTLNFVILFKIILNRLNSSYIKYFINILVFFVVISVILILLHNPFIQNKVYQFQFNRWSHVVYSRFLGPVVIILFSYYFTLRKKKDIAVYSIVLGLGLYGIYISNLRAALIGLVIFMPILFFLKALRKKVNLNNLFGVLFLLVICFSLISILPGTSVANERYSSLSAQKESLTKDPSIKARILAYSLCKEIIKHYPILGIGLGGFRNYEPEEDIKLIDNSKVNKNFNWKEFTRWIKYPHNIFLEFQVEMGIAGTFFFLFILYLIFSSVKKYSADLVILFLYALWLALFSKDIPSNGLLFLGLAFYGKPYDKDKLKEWVLPNK